MNEVVAPAAITAPTVTAVKDAFDRLNFLGWRWGLTAVVAGLAASFFLFGYALVYWRNADMDFMVIYNALALNDGKPQVFFDHTAYITILSVKYWFWLLHELGLLDAWSLSTVPPASDAAGFDAAMTRAVRAARLLALLTATGCVLMFAVLIRRVVHDWRIAMMAIFAFAFSGGVAVHSRIVRSELVAACPVIFALLILIAAGRRGTVARPLALAAAAALCVLGLENKVQAILLIGALPILVLPFGGAASASVGFWRHSRFRWLATFIAAIAAIAAMAAAWPIITIGFDAALLQAAQFRPLLLGRFGVYQTALLVLIGACMVGYGAIWHVSIAETLASMFAVSAGALVMLHALDLAYNASNVVAVINPLEKMLTFANASTADAISGSSVPGILWLLLNGIAAVLARYSFVLHSSPRPTVFLVWLIVPGIVYAWQRSKRQAAVQASVLLLAAIGIDALGVGRGLKSESFIFTDPLLILAGAVLLDSLSDLGLHKWAYPVAAVLSVLHLTIGQAESIKYAFMRRGPESICEWDRYYLPLLSLPWCPIRS
jgi:hypothetical protein